MSKQSEAVKRWRHTTKQKLIMAMGGKCVICGYNKCADVLEFHHIDPTEKEVHWGALRANIKSLKKIVQEMKKCTLLCSNCHKEVHSSRCETKLPDTCPTIDEEKLWAIHEGVHEDVPKDNCPVCGKVKPTWYMTCSLKCGHKQSGTKIKWDKYDVLKMYETMHIGDIADVIGCSSGAVSKRIRKLDPTGEIIYNIRSKKQPYKDRVINILNNKPLYKVLDVDIIKEYNKTNNYEAVGRKYGVTGAAVKRRLKQIK